MSALKTDIAQPSEEIVKQAETALRELRPLQRLEPVEIQIAAASHAASVTVPPAVFNLLIRILSELAVGNGVTVLPINAEVTTQQAADLLNVSRPYLVGLLEAGKIPYRKVGARRRILMQDLLAYKHRDDAARRKILDSLTADAEDLNLGY